MSARVSTVLAANAQVRADFGPLHAHVSLDVDSGVWTVDCPSCAGECYVDGYVCSECFGVGDLGLSDVEEIAAMLDRWL